MIFAKQLINGVRNGTITRTVRPCLPSHPAGGPWKVGDVVQVKSTLAGAELLRIEIQGTVKTTIGELDLRTLAACGFKQRERFIEVWMNQTHTVDPPKPGKLVWVVAFRPYSAARFLANREPRDLAVSAANRTEKTSPAAAAAAAAAKAAMRRGDATPGEQVVPIADEHGYVHNGVNEIDACLSEDELKELAEERLAEWRRKRGPEVTLRELDALLGRMRQVRAAVQVKGVDLHADHDRPLERLSAQVGGLERKVRAA